MGVSGESTRQRDVNALSLTGRLAGKEVGEMKFRISSGEPNIRWPERCVWCGAKPAMRYEDSAKGLIGSGIFPPSRTYRKVRIDYPVCRKHGLWLSVLRLGYSVSIWGVLFGLMIHYSLSLFFVAVILANLFLIPVRISKISEHFHTLTIRDEDYAREFTLLNSFDPL